MKLLMTGATGLLGQALLPLLAPTCQKIWLMVRPGRSRPELDQLISTYPQIEILAGDLVNPQLFKNPEHLAVLHREVDTIVHAGAFYDLYGDQATNFLTNIVGTQNLLFQARDNKKLKAFHHVSSIAVAGDFKGAMPEAQLDLKQQFHNPYGQTKFESEYHVRKAPLNGIKRIYRPGVLIGHSETGKIIKRDGPYYFFDFLSKLKKTRWPYLPLPYSPKGLLPLIPYNFCAELMADEIMKPARKKEPIRTYHVFSEDSPRLQEFVEEALRSAGLGQTKPIPLPLSWKTTLASSGLMRRLGFPEQLLDYMYPSAEFDQTMAREDLKRLPEMSFQSYKNQFYGSQAV